MIELYAIPAGIPEDLDQSRPIVILDIFRASTSMAAALAAGAEKLIFAGSLAEADNMKNSFGKSLVMAGEREGFRIEGYDLGNSPREMTPDTVKGKTVLFNSTNGTKLLRRFDQFRNVLVGSFVTMTAAVKYLNNFDADPVICCAGTNGRYSTEDVLAGGMLVAELERPDKDKDDAALAAERLFRAAGEDWAKQASESFHGRYLASIGLTEDLNFCTERDRFDFVPIKKEGFIIR